MKMQIVRSSTRMRSGSKRIGSLSRSMAVKLGALALAVVFTASQMQAQSGVAAVSADTQPATTAQQAQAATAVPTIPSDKADAQTAAPVPTADAQDAVTITVQPAVPDAPGGQTESASLNTPINMKALMDQAAQPSQNVQSASTTEQKKQIHPGWLGLAAVGLLCAALGAGGLAEGNGNKSGLAAGFLAGGLGVAGLSFYLTFK